MILNTFRATFAGIATLILSGCSAVGVHDVKEPPFKVVQTDGDFEIRHYQPMIVASTVVTGNFKEAGKKGFRPLFNYISGDNEAASSIPMTAPVISGSVQSDGQEIPMTAPVIAQGTENQWEYQFVLPSGMAFEDAPIPTNPDVTIKKIDEKEFAVLTFSGLLSEKNRIKNTEKLKSWMQEKNLVQKNIPMIAGYDPPWTVPFLRRNEILIQIK